MPSEIHFLLCFVGTFSVNEFVLVLPDSMVLWKRLSEHFCVKLLPSKTVVDCGSREFGSGRVLLQLVRLSYLTRRDLSGRIETVMAGILMQERILGFTLGLAGGLVAFIYEQKHLWRSTGALADVYSGGKSPPAQIFDNLVRKRFFSEGDEQDFSRQGFRGSFAAFA